MYEEHHIIRQVYEAKEDTQAADRLIGAYMPFIKVETAKFLNRPPMEGQDDELSIAMIAFHEAIGRYSRGRGTFLKYAAVLIRNRLIDYERREKRHRLVISLDAPAGEEETPILETVAGKENHGEEIAVRDATRAEIEELSRQMEQFGISLTDVADNCPKQARTLEICRKAVQKAQDDPEILEEFLRTKRLPMARLAGGSGERKTLERHRKYMVALLLIHTNGYEIIRGHIRQVLKGGAAQ